MAPIKLNSRNPVGVINEPARVGCSIETSQSVGHPVDINHSQREIPKVSLDYGFNQLPRFVERNNHIDLVVPLVKGDSEGCFWLFRHDIVWHNRFVKSLRDWRALRGTSCFSFGFSCRADALLGASHV